MIAAVPCRPDQALIAIVEDEPMVLMALTILMETLGYGVVGGEDHEAVLAGLGDRAPDIIIADYRLRGGRTGIEAISCLRAALGDGIPALLVTGDTSASWQAEAAALRLPVLQKPVTPRQLAAAIEQLVPA